MFTFLTLEQEIDHVIFNRGFYCKETVVEEENEKQNSNETTED